MVMPMLGKTFSKVYVQHSPHRLKFEMIPTVKEQKLESTQKIDEKKLNEISKKMDTCKSCSFYISREKDSIQVGAWFIDNNDKISPFTQDKDIFKQNIDLTLVRNCFMNVNNFTNLSEVILSVTNLKETEIKPKEDDLFDSVYESSIKTNLGEKVTDLKILFYLKKNKLIRIDQIRGKEFGLLSNLNLFFENIKPIKKNDIETFFNVPKNIPLDKIKIKDALKEVKINQKKEIKPLNELGYKFNDKLELIEIETGGKFKWKGQKHYDELGDSVLVYIQKELVKKYELIEINLKPVNIFHSKDAFTTEDTLLVICQGKD
jgi:hypothetical protein